MPFLRDLTTQFSGALAQQSATKKLMAAVVMAAVVGLLVFLVARYGRTIDYDVLYAGLDPDMSRTVEAQLRAQGVDFRVSQVDRGRVIRVPADRVLDLRLDLAPDAEPSGGKAGWELFDKTMIGVTHFVQKINRQRATQGEMARTIRSLDAVKQASVTIATPEETPFVRDDKAPKASVLVELYPGLSLAPDQVEAIQALVAGGIEGLTRQNVVVVDTSGNLLTRQWESEEEGRERVAFDLRSRLLREQRDQRRTFEKHLEDKILDSLSNIFGVGHVTAQVNADLDFTVKETTEQKYDPETVIVAEALTTTGQGPASLIAQGITGSSAHVQPPGASSAASGAGGAELVDLTREQIRNYNVGVTQTRTVPPPYQIRRLTAAVLVDNIPKRTSGKNGDAQITREPLAPDQLTKVEDQVKQIINYNEERRGGLSDVVSVHNLPFSVSEREIIEEETVSRLHTWRSIITLTKYAALCVAALIVVLFIVRPLMGIVAPKVTPSALEAPRVAPAVAGAPERALLAPSPEEEALAEGAEISPGRLAEEEVKRRQRTLDKEILELAHENPKKVSQILRSWIEA